MQRKYKILAIIVASILAISTAGAVANYYASYSRTLSWTVANTQFQVDVNGTAIGQTSSNSFGPETSLSTYCEVYTLTNEGNVPITITGDAYLTASSVGTAILNWMGGPIAALAPGQVTAIILQLSDFSAPGTVDVSFTGVPTYPAATLISNFNVVEINDADSSPHAADSTPSANWALDSFTQNVQIYNLGDSNYAAFRDYVGTWQTYAGVLTPGSPINSEIAEGASGSGPMLFSFVSTFNYAGAFPTIPATINANAGGSYTSGDSVTAGAGYSWLSTYFSGYTAYAEPFGELAYYQYGTLNYNSAPYAQFWSGFGSGHSDIVIPA